MQQFQMLSLILLISFPFFLNSCSTEIDLVTDWEEGMAVYALLDPQDSVHYVRVNRVFLDPQTSALTIAQNPDSIYYGDELEVKISEFPNGPQFIAHRVNAADLGMDKKDGVFANSPNILYRFEHTLRTDRRYQVDVTNGSTGHQATGSTFIVGSVDLTFPVSTFVYQFNMNATNQRINFRTPENGKIYQLIVRFNYEEWEINNPSVKTSKHVDWMLFSNIISPSSAGGQNIENTFNATQFYQFIANNIPVDPTKRRQVKFNGCFDIIILSGGESLYHFMQSEGAQSGLVSGSTPVRFTNIDNGYGLLSSRNKSVFPNWQITPGSIDSLSCGQFTSQLNFADRNGFFECN